MSLTVELDSGARVIRAVATGTVRLSDMIPALAQVLDHLAQSEVRELLVDARELQHAPVFDLVQIMREIPHSLRIAAIISDQSQTDILFAKSEGEKRNLSFEVFRDEPSALDWLRLPA